MKKINTLVASLVVLGIAAGCGSSASKSGSGTKVLSKLSPVELVAGSADATNAKKSARIDATIKMSGSSFAALGKDSMTITMDGRMSLDGTSGELSMDMGAILPTASGTKINMLMVDGAMYMDFSAMMGAMSGQLGSNKLPAKFANMKWLKIEVSGAGANSSPTSYTQYLEYLRGASKDGLKEVGEETIDGAKTKHFRASIDLSKLNEEVDKGIKGLDAEQAAMIAKGLDALGGLESIPMEVWIDDEGVLRRMKMQLDTKAGGEEMSMDMVMNFTDFGVDVSDIKAPPADEVIDMNDFQSSLLG